jgi:hypothetical protein
VKKTGQGFDILRVWFNSRMRPCQGRDDGATPFTRSNFARVAQQQRHDVENVTSAGAIAGRDGDQSHLGHLNRKAWEAHPAASTTFEESKPQQTGTGLLIRFGEVATTSGSTSPLVQ